MECITIPCLLYKCHSFSCSCFPIFPSVLPWPNNEPACLSCQGTMDATYFGACQMLFLGQPETITELLTFPRKVEEWIWLELEFPTHHCLIRPANTGSPGQPTTWSGADVSEGDTFLVKESVLSKCLSTVFVTLCCWRGHLSDGREKQSPNCLKLLGIAWHLIPWHIFRLVSLPNSG